MAIKSSDKSGSTNNLYEVAEEFIANGNSASKNKENAFFEYSAELPINATAKKYVGDISEYDVLGE